MIYTSHWFVKRSQNRKEFLTKRQAEADVEQQLWNDVQTGAIQDFEHIITRVLPTQYEVIFEVTREA